MQYTHTFAISSKSSSGNIIMRIFCEKILIKRTNLHYISTDTSTFNILTIYRWTKRQLHEKTGKIAARCNRTLSLQFGNNLFVRIHLKTCQHDGLLHHTWLLRSWYTEPSIYLSATLHRLNCPIDISKSTFGISKFCFTCIDYLIFLSCSHSKCSFIDVFCNSVFLWGFRDSAFVFNLYLEFYSIP